MEMEVVEEGAQREGIKVSFERTRKCEIDDVRRIERLTGLCVPYRQPDRFEPAFLCAVCEADCYFGGRWMNVFLVCRMG